MPPNLPPRPHAALLAVAAGLDRAGVRWVLAGSAGRALLGHRVRPADIDVEVAEEDSVAAGAALGAPLRAEAGGGRASLRGSTRRAGVVIDVTAGLVVEGATHTLRADDGAQLDWCHRVRSGGRTIPVAPVEEAVARALVLGAWATLARIASQAAAGAASPVPRAGYLARRLSSATARAAR